MSKDKQIVWDLLPDSARPSGDGPLEACAAATVSVAVNRAFAGGGAAASASSEAKPQADAPVPTEAPAKRQGGTAATNKDDLVAVDRPAPPVAMADRPDEPTPLRSPNCEGPTAREAFGLVGAPAGDNEPAAAGSAAAVTHIMSIGVQYNHPPRDRIQNTYSRIDAP